MKPIYYRCVNISNPRVWHCKGPFETFEKCIANDKKEETVCIDANSLLSLNFFIEHGKNVEIVHACSHEKDAYVNPASHVIP